MRPVSMHTAGQLVQVVAGIAHQGHQLLQLRQFQAHHITVQGHLAQVGFPVRCPSWAIFCSISASSSGETGSSAAPPACAWGAHRSGSFFYRADDFSPAFQRGAAPVSAGGGPKGRRWRSSLERSLAGQDGDAGAGQVLHMPVIARLRKRQQRHQLVMSPGACAGQKVWRKRGPCRWVPWGAVGGIRGTAAPARAAGRPRREFPPASAAGAADSPAAPG